MPKSVLRADGLPRQAPPPSPSSLLPLNRSRRKSLARRDPAKVQLSNQEASHRKLLLSVVFLLASLAAVIGNLQSGLDAFAAGPPSASNIRSEQFFYAYVGSGENIDISFEKASNVNDAGDVAVVIRPERPGGLAIAPCTLTAASAVGAAGSSCTFANQTSATPGIWRIMFDVGGNANSIDRYTWTINVQTSANVTIPGRVWSEEYRMTQVSTSTANPSFWYVTEQGYQYRADYTNYNGIDSVFRSDGTGVRFNGQCVSAYRSIGTVGADSNLATLSLSGFGECGDPTKIFFEAPSASLPETATRWDGTPDWIRPAVATPTVTDVQYVASGGASRAGDIEYAVSDFTGQLTVQIDVNNDNDYTDTEDVTLPGFATGGTGSVTWDGLSGAGATVPVTQAFGVRVLVDRTAEIHFALQDAERRAGGIEIEVINGPTAGDQTIYWDDSDLPEFDRCGTTPILDGSAGANSAGGVHGWTNDAATCPGGPSEWNANSGTEGSWGDSRIIDDWAFVPVDAELEIDVPAGAAGPSFSCDGAAYIVGLNTGVNTEQLWRVNSDASPFTFETVGPTHTGFELNAMGYNPADNLLYAINLVSPGTPSFEVQGLSTIDNTGAVSTPIAITGLPEAVYISGDINPDDGMLYVYASNAANMYRIDLSTHVAEAVPLTQALVIGDFAFHPDNGLLYTTGTPGQTGANSVIQINPATGDVTFIPITSGNVEGTGGHYFGADGTLFAYGGGDHLYQIDIDATGGPAVISDNTVPGAARADAASCNAHDPAADLSVDKAADASEYSVGLPLTYTVSVFNHGPDSAEGVTVTDTLPAGVTYQSATGTDWDCVQAAGTVTCTRDAALGLGPAPDITISVVPTGTAADPAVNNAAVTSTTEDPDDTNNEDEESTPRGADGPPVVSCTSDSSLFNTAYDGAGGRLALGERDRNWDAGLGDTTGPASVATWIDAWVTGQAGSWVAPLPTAGWISHVQSSIHAGNVDVYFRYQFLLDPLVVPSTLSLPLDWYADNSVFAIYINGVLQTVPGVPQNAANPYFHVGFVNGAQASTVLNTGWQTGLNEIIVHIKSGAPAIGFLAQVTSSGLCADYGDAPETFGTVAGDNGAGHLVPDYDSTAHTAPLMLGPTIDVEGDGVPGADANGDDLADVDDEDALSAPIELLPGATSADLQVPVTNTTGGDATLYGWIDANNDGVFQASEFASVVVADGATTATLSWSGLTPLPGGTQPYLRLRLTTTALTDDAGTTDVDERALGAAPDGEVEDYRATIGQALPVFSCDANAPGMLFQATGPGVPPTSVQFIDLVTGEDNLGFTVDDFQVNAVGYNVLDNYVYGWANTANPRGGQLVRIGADGSVTPLGRPAGVPNSISGVGEVDENGHYWTIIDDNWYQIDLATLTLLDSGVVQGDNIGAFIGGVDWAMVPGGGDYLYRVMGNSGGTASVLFGFNRSTGQFENLGNLGVLSNNVFGATYADADGFLYVSSNATGQIFRVDVTASPPSATFFAQGPTSQQNDGTRCANSLIPVDFGDAPNTFGTDLASDGARHNIPGYDDAAHTAPLMLGTTIDIETDGVPTADADGDDNAADIDDEDAVSSPISFTTGEPTTVPVTVTNNTGADATLAAWADLNGNGTFDPAERVIVTVAPGATSVNVGFGPASAVCRDVRFRIFPGTVADPLPTGPAAAGEVEDHHVVVAPNCTTDDVALTISGVAQAWTPGSRVQSANFPASNAVNAPDGVGTQLYSGASPASTLTLDLATVVPEGNVVTIHIAQVAGFEGPVRIAGSADGVNFTNIIDHTPSTTQPIYEEFNYLVGAGGARFIRIVPLADATGHTAVRVDAITYSYTACEREDAVNLVRDGSFEGFDDCSVQSGTFGAWSVTQGNIHIWGSTCTRGWNSPDGRNSVDLDGGTTGGIQQTISGLTVGNTYNLTFYMAFNPAAGAPSSSMRVQVGNFDRTYTSASNAQLGSFNLVHVEFTAQSTIETLRFTSLTGTGGGLLNNGGTPGFGVVIDDIRITPQDCSEVVVAVLDFGDAPDSYATTLTADGPRHNVPGLNAATNTAPLMLGSAIDVEDDGAPTPSADGDDLAGVDDEDAFSAAISLNPGSTSPSLIVPVTNTTGGSATLYGWIDANNNGSFEANEFASVAVPNGATSAQLSWSGISPLLDGAQPYLRFRLTTATLTDDVGTPVDERAQGVAPDGEVEDHRALTATTVPVSCDSPFVETFGTGPNYGPALPVGQTTYGHVTSGLIIDGNYGLISSLSNAQGGWWHNGPDHTPGDTDGYMMVVNASVAPGIFFQKTFSGLTLGAIYDFSAWVTNANDAGSPIRPNVTFRVIDPATNAVLATTSTGNIEPTSAAVGLVWTRSGMTFTATQSTVRLEVVNNAPGGSGNDLALDDIAFGQVCEWGDAPDGYGTTGSTGGAGHVAAGPTLGTGRDSETDGQPAVGADGDDTNGTDDEDGVLAPISIQPGQPQIVTVSATNNSAVDATLAGWVDLDGDGVFEVTERVVVVVPANSGTANYDLPFPAGTTTQPTYARFRIFGEPIVDPQPVGIASNGEVEDYVVDVRSVEYEKTVSPDNLTQLQPGQTLEYTVTVTNTGSVPLTGLSFSDDLSNVVDDADYNNDVAADIGNANFNVGPPATITWSGDLGAGEVATVTYSVTVQNPPGGDGVLLNGLIGTGPGNCTEDPPVDPECFKEVPQPQVSGVKTVVNAPDPVVPGSVVTYQFTVTNTGPAPALAATTKTICPACWTMQPTTATRRSRRLGRAA